jgi:hypothetical protein
MSSPIEDFAIVIKDCSSPEVDAAQLQKLGLREAIFANAI